MRFISMTCFSLLAIIVLVLFSCTKKTETFQTASLGDYFPLSAGKYISYRIDSTIFTNFGSAIETRSYQVKHVIESQITDNLGRPSYRVFRYLRDTAGTQPWNPAGSYFITPLSDQIESVEDNFRFIKMHLPIREEFTWKGNKYLNSEPYSTLYTFTNDDGMDKWDYYYKDVHDVFQYKQQMLNDVVNIVQIDERFALDTANVVGNKVTIPANSSATYIRGNATDTIIITASNPTTNENLTIYNRSGFAAKLNNIVIPPGLSLGFEFYNNKWNYPNPFYVDAVGNNVSVSGSISLAYIFGAAKDSIKINISQLDTSFTKKITISNKADTVVLLNGIVIPRNHYRIFELKNGQWNYYNGINIAYKNDPYSDELPFGSTNYSIEKYAKNIGLVFKEFTMWDYQPNNGGQKRGFGIRMWMIDHN